MTSTPHPLIETWLTALHREGKSRHTLTGYRRALTHFARWSEQTYGQPFDPAAIIPRDVADWQTFQQTIENAKAATINLRMVALSRFFKWAVAHEHIPRNPVEPIKTLRPEPRRPKSLPEKSLRRLLRAVHAGDNLRDIALVELLVGTGLRVSEALALRRGDVTLNARSGEVRVRRGKGGISRTVPLTATVRRTLNDYLALYPEMGTDDPLWVGERGALKSPSGVFRLLKKYARLAGLDETDVSPHVLRHTFATRYLAANPDDLRRLAALLGHASLDMVMIYTEATTDDLARRMEMVEQKTVISLTSSFSSHIDD